MFVLIKEEGKNYWAILEFLDDLLTSLFISFD